MPGLLLSRFPFPRISAAVTLACLAVAAQARAPKLQNYPLRVHVLASDETHRTPRMSPAEAVACDGVEDMLSAVDHGSETSFTPIGISGDPCSLNAGVVVGRLLNLDAEPVFSGEGRGDLVTPPSATQAITFQYDDCLRVRPYSGFASLPARWRKNGRLEVLFPSEELPGRSRKPLPPMRCSLRVQMHDFVYLRLRDGKIVEVSQQFYQSKPALRVFLSGGPAEVVKARPVQVAAAVQPSAK